MAPQTPLRRVVSAALFFVIVFVVQLLFERIFGDAIDSRYLLQAAITSAIMTALFTFFTWRRLRR